MRRYIRHPSEIPLFFHMVDCDGQEFQKHYPTLKDVGEGGLCFTSRAPLSKGAAIQIKIPLQDPPFSAEGSVAWCRQDGDRYAVGVEFDESTSRFSLRMVEQVCYIEQYRVLVEQREGRTLTSEDAANEWVHKYAADFPELTS